MNLNVPLEQSDPEIFNLINQERERQIQGLELIASENFTSRAVLDSLGSILTNKYSEGLPNKRYYGGNEYIDQIEIICQTRALTAFNLDNKKWGVNVQPYSGSPANFAVYTALLNPHDRLMGLDLPSGGHLTHGYQTDKKKLSATSLFWESMPYKVDPNTGFIDYDKMEELALIFRPKILIAGASAYPRDWDYARMRKIADSVHAYLMADIAHISGLVLAGEANNAFDYCDIVTTTTHKTLRGPRGAMIFFRVGDHVHEGVVVGQYDFENKINSAVFPGLQGGPHNNVIGGIATALREASSDEFKDYARQIKANAKALADALRESGYSLVTDGTDNHLVLWNLKPLNMTGSKMEALFEMVHISVNKNTVFGDPNALAPKGLRVGTPAVTSRGMKEDDMRVIASFLDRGIKIAQEIQKIQEGNTLAEFKKLAKGREDIAQLLAEVKNFAKNFPLPGI